MTEPSTLTFSLAYAATLTIAALMLLAHLAAFAALLVLAGIAKVITLLLRPALGRGIIQGARHVR